MKKKAPKGVRKPPRPQREPYSQLQLGWVAWYITALPRQELYSEFERNFSRPLGRNELAGMMFHHGGSKEKFIAKNRPSRKPVIKDAAPPAASVPEPLVERQPAPPKKAQPPKQKKKLPRRSPAKQVVPAEVSFPVANPEPSPPLPLQPVLEEVNLDEIPTAEPIEEIKTTTENEMQDEIRALPALESDPEQILENAHIKLLRLWQQPRDVLDEPPELAREQQIIGKRAGALDLIYAAVRGKVPIEHFAIRALQKRGGPSEFLMHLGYTPEFAKVVEEVLVATLPSKDREHMS